MESNYKSLVLVDNSLSVGKGNQEITRATLSYLFEQAGEEETFSMAVFGEQTHTLADYDVERETLVKTAKNLTYENQDTYVTDALMNVLMKWQESDFACRSIILITDGKSEESLIYPDEELYFMLDKAEYPVYVIGCVDGKNQAQMKNLAAIARISGGEIFYTEFENSENSVEQKLGDALLAAMKENHIHMESKVTAEPGTTGQTEQSAADSEIPGQNTASEIILEETISENELFLSASEEQEAVIYEMETESGQTPAWGNSLVVILFSVLFGMLLLLTAAGIVVRKNRVRKQREKEFMEGLQTEIKQHSALLTENMDDSCGATRLLFQQEQMHDVVLEDRSNPARFFRTACKDRLVIGRSANVCDLVIDYDNSISGKHCELFLQDERWFARDLQSSNGTKVNGQKVYQELELRSGDILKLGHLEFRVGL